MVSNKEAAVLSLALGTVALVALALFARSRKPVEASAKPSSVPIKVPKTKSDAEATSAPDSSQEDGVRTTVKPEGEVRKKADLSQEESVLGTKAFKTGSYAAAIEHFSRAIQLCPKEDLGSRKVLLNNKAAAHERLEQWEAALADCSSALSIDPVYRRALTRRAKVLEQLGKLEDALEDLALWKNLDVMTLSQEERNQVAESMDRIARGLAKVDAAKIWEQRRGDSALQIDIPRPEACRQFYYGMSLEARRMRSPPSSMAIKDAIDNLNPSSKSYVEDLLTIATMFKHRLELKDAQKYWEQVKSSSEASSIAKAQALSEISGLFQLTGNRALAREHLEAAQRLHDSSQIWVGLAGLAMEDGDFAGAKTCLDRAFTKIVNGPDAMFHRADINYHRGAYICLEGTDLQTARELLESAVADVPDFGVAHMQLGIVLFRMGLADEALASLEQARLLVPELAEAWNLNGEVLMSLNRRDEALSCFEEASHVDELCALPLLNKGVMWMTKEDGSVPSEEDLGKAIELFDKAVQVDPSNEICYIHRASYYCQIGDLQAALKNYDEAIRLVKSLPYLTEYLTFRYICAADEHVQDKLAKAVA